MRKTKNEIDNDLLNEMLGRSTMQIQSSHLTEHCRQSVATEDSAEANVDSKMETKNVISI